MKEIDELNQAILALEAQRTLLGDRVVDAAQASLREKLANLEDYAPTGRQRRLVSVLFLDIANSTRLSQGLEPEEVQEIIGGILKRLAAPVENLGGQVIQYVGDGFMAVFGLKVTRENDARQAVRAGLAILAECPACAAELEQRHHMPGFNVRLGINTGRVVSGRFSEAQSPVMGLTVSLASRMEEAAQPGSLLISQFTYQHVRGAFDVEALKPVSAKGFPRRVVVYRVQAARPRTFRTFTRGVQGLETRLVGRAAELAELQAALNHTIKEHQTCLTTIKGEAGVGKSRLLYEFDRWIAQFPTPVAAFKVRPSLQMADVPFSVLRELISYHLGILTTDPAELTRRCLVEAVSAVLQDEPEMKAHFIGTLLGFDFSGSPYLQGVENDPRQLSTRGQLYLTEYLSASAGTSATIFMIDDIHWADAPSVSFIIQFIQQHPQLPLLVVCLGRPPLVEIFPGLWQEDMQAELPPGRLQLSLGPLSPSASQELLAEILRNVEALPEQLSRRILDRADGNPFYLEEFIQALLDAKVIRSSPRRGRWKLDLARLGSLELPDTLVALLEARLDNLDADHRALLQQAAVIGAVFWRSALQAVHSAPPILDADLALLARRGFIYTQEPSTFEDTEEYHFHHALLRDVAYQALLKPDRMSDHGKVASWLVETTKASGRSGEFASIIADHYEQAGELLIAADWYTQAGERARHQGAPEQARTFFDHALSLLPPEVGPSTPAADLARHWQALAGRDEVLGILGDTAARMADDRALVELAILIGDDHLIAEAYYRQSFSLGQGGYYSLQLDSLRLGLQFAQRVGDQSRQALLLGLKVLCEERLGDLESAARTAMNALSCAYEASDDQVIARNVINVSGYYTEIGDMARAVQLLEQQLPIMHRSGNIQDEVVGLSNLGYTYILLGLPEVSIPTLKKCIAISQTIGQRKICVYGGLNLALAYLHHGDQAAALEQLSSCLPALLEMNDVFYHAIATTYQGLIFEQGSRVQEALACFAQASARLAEIGAPHNLQDARAGIARCQLVLQDLPAAQREVTLLWQYLEQHGGGGLEFPVLAYETCADFFSTIDQVTLARHAVGAGYGELILRAGRISLPEWCQSFLERVPEHRRIRERWQKYMDTK